MTAGTPGRPGVNSARWTRERLLRLGLTDEHLVLSEVPKQERLTSADLEPAHYAPEYANLVQRVQRLLRAGRGLSVYVTGRRLDSLPRQHAALQIALGLVPLGRQVVLVDVDFLRPGLGGLVPDAEAEGVIDMVRFGRSCRSLLLRPVSEGPWMLPAGSFPVEEPMPLGPEALRSLVYRVSQVCDLALYVGPLPVGNEIHPLARVCDHVVYAALDEDPDSGQALVDALGELQKQNAHVAGVAIYATELEPAILPEVEATPPTMPVFEPGFLYAPPYLVGPPRPALPPPPLDLGVPEPEPSPWSAAAAEPEPLAPAAVEPGYEMAWEPASEPEPVPVGELPADTDAHRFATRHEAEEEERARRELAGAITGRAVQRSGDEARQVRDDLALVDSEFAVDDDGRYSRAPLYLLVTLIVLILGFGGFMLYMHRQEVETSSHAAAPPGTSTPGAPANGAASTPTDQAPGSTAPAAPPEGVVSGTSKPEPTTTPTSGQDAVTSRELISPVPRTSPHSHAAISTFTVTSGIFISPVFCTATKGGTACRAFLIPSRELIASFCV